MTFYLQPPSGNVSYQKLEEFGLNRFKFLARLVACKDEAEQREAVLDAETVNWSDCLIAGSVKDKISHFILRLALAHDVNFTKFLCDAETILFRMRLDSFSIQDWLSFFKTLRKTLYRHQNENLNDICVFFNSLCNESTSWPSLIEGIKDKEDEFRIVHVPFQLVLRLVAERRVILNQGFASLPLCLIPDVLEELFKGLMIKMLQLTRQQQQRTGHVDSRMSRMSAILKRSYQREVNLTTMDITLGSKALSLDSMTSSQVCFPLCMSQLMTTLEKHHRLCHRDRIQLTLFMKELGLPLHQALLFWKREYSKPSIARLNGVSCGHDWRGNERRYIYNIRHLYGLEGKRVSYTAHSCASIQGRQLSCVDCGGCPFTALEPPALTRALSKEGLVERDIEDILLHVNKGCVAGACTMTTRHRMKWMTTPDKSCTGHHHHRHFSDSTKINQENISCGSRLSYQNDEKSYPSEFHDHSDDDNDCIIPLTQSSRFVTSQKVCNCSSGYKNNIEPCGNFGFCRDHVETDGDDVFVKDDCDESEKDLACGVSSSVKFIRRKRCIHGIDCDNDDGCNCRKERKLYHCCDEHGSENKKLYHCWDHCGSGKTESQIRIRTMKRHATVKSAENRVTVESMGNHVTVESTDESQVEKNFQKCGIEATSGTSLEAFVINECHINFQSTDDEKCLNCHGNTEIKDFTRERNQKSFKDCFDTGECNNCSNENDLQNNRQTEPADNLKCDNNNKCGSVHCSVRKREMFLQNGRNSCRTQYVDDNRLTRNVGRSKSSESFISHKKKPSSIYWDVKSFSHSF